MDVHLRYGCASQVWTCISGTGVHLKYGTGVHLRYGCASQVWVCISGGRNEALKGRTQVCRHQREEVGHSLAKSQHQIFLFRLATARLLKHEEDIIHTAQATWRPYILHYS